MNTQFPISLTRPQKFRRLICKILESSDLGGIADARRGEGCELWMSEQAERAYRVSEADQMSALLPEKVSGPFWETTSGGWNIAVPWWTLSASLAANSSIACIPQTHYNVTTLQTFYIKELQSHLNTVYLWLYPWLPIWLKFEGRLIHTLSSFRVSSFSMLISGVCLSQSCNTHKPVIITGFLHSWGPVTGVAAYNEWWWTRVSNNFPK